MFSDDNARTGRCREWLNMERKTLFTPGPVMTTPTVKASLGHPDMPHRMPAFTAVFRSCVARIKALAGADDAYDVALVTGSGSAANECVLSSVVRPGEEVLLISNGSFGERLQDIMDCYGVVTRTHKKPWGVPADLGEVERLLKEHPAIGWVALCWHETGSGMRMPVKDVGELAHRYGKRVFVDAVSAFAAEDIHVLRDHIDVMTSVGNKAVGGVTGVAFVLARGSAVPPLGPTMPRRNVYLNLQNHLKWSREHGQTPNTPAVTAMVALEQALKELQDETLPKRIARIADMSRMVRQGLHALGLRFLLPEEQMTHCLTSAFLPEGVEVDAFIERLNAHGFVVYPGKGVWHDQNLFQVATMGAVTERDTRALMTAISETIAELKRAAA